MHFLECKIITALRLLTQHRAADVERLDEVAQEGTLDPGESPAAQLVTAGHAADFGAPDARVEVRSRDHQALGVVLQLHSTPRVGVPKQK